MSFIKKNIVYILLSLIAASGLFLRLLPLTVYYKLPIQIQSDMAYNGDAIGYQKFALLFLNKGTFSVLDKKNEIYQQVSVPQLTTFRVPLYPYFLSRIYLLFGNNTFPVFLAQTILDTVTIITIFAITLLIFKRKRIALVAALLYAFSPLAIMYATSFYSDCLFTFVFTIFTLFLIVAIKKNYFYWWLITGFTLGIATLVKPIGIYFLPVIVVGLFFAFTNYKKNWKKYCFAVILIVVAFFVTISPWQFRNLYVAGHYSLTWQQGRDLLVFREGICLTWTQGVDRKTLWNELQKPYQKIKDSFVRSSLEGKQALQYIKTHPVDYFNCNVKGIKNFFISKNVFITGGANGFDNATYMYNSNGITNTFLNTMYPDRNAWVNYSTLYNYALLFEYVIILIGSILLLLKKEYRFFVTYSILTIIYFALISGINGYIRYRYPLTPIMAVLMAASIFVIIELVSKYAKKFFNKK